MFPIPLSKIFSCFKNVYEKGLLPYWREGMYDQLVWRIRESLWKICRLVNKSVNYWACKNLFASPCRFPNDIWGFWTSKSSKSECCWQCAQWSKVGVSFLFFVQNMLHLTKCGRVSFLHFFKKNLFVSLDRFPNDILGFLGEK